MGVRGAIRDAKFSINPRAASASLRFSRTNTRGSRVGIFATALRSRCAAFACCCARWERMIGEESALRTCLLALTRSNKAVFASSHAFSTFSFSGRRKRRDKQSYGKKRKEGEFSRGGDFREVKFGERGRNS